MIDASKQLIAQERIAYHSDNHSILRMPTYIKYSLTTFTETNTKNKQVYNNDISIHPSSQDITIMSEEDESTSESESRAIIPDKIFYDRWLADIFGENI